ncbi:DUF4339 domain-containing protein [Roseiarcaceae bacterium H3SJ34-1]|uniref:DUF4339 domain-containing protein n=1 Tax=Terripilifer ovatus TaxID=3032367 RepID=UPI003AB94F2C|nr:DUF4339 domain-containing protein [Roseiarcaceae bacterium H3SJ34-1]
MGLDGGEGWYLSSNGKQIGPLATGDMLARATAGGFAAADLVWHPSMQGWTAASEVFVQRGKTAAPKPDLDSSQWLRLPEIKIRNFTYLIVLFAVAVACFIMMATAFLSDDSSLTLPLLGIFAILGWCCFLECRGTTLRNTSLIFPARPPFWPHLLAYRMITISLDQISSAGVFSNGDHAHGLVLGFSVGQVRLMFDDPFFRDLTLAAIAARSPHLNGAPKNVG